MSGAPRVAVPALVYHHVCTCRHSSAVFLRARVATLDPNRSLGDEFAALGREVFLYYPNGTARSKLTNAYFDSRLSTTSTSRNWRTVGKLLAMVTETA